MRYTAAIIGCLILSACENSKSEDRYQLVPSAGGAVYRLDKQTGDVAEVTDQGLRPIGIHGDSGDKVTMPAETTVGKYKVQQLPDYCSRGEAKKLSNAQLCSCIGAGFDAVSGRCK